MRTDYSLISTAPPEEECVSGDDPDAARKEGRRYIELIRLVCGHEPPGAQLVVRANPHDLGTYYTVDLMFDDADQRHVEYMLLIDGDGPLTWDDDKPRQRKPKDENEGFSPAD